MKSKIKRALALMLCLSMILNGSVSALADDGTLTDEQQTVSEEIIEEVVEEEATEDVAAEEEVTEDVAVEETIEVVTEDVAETTPITLNWSENGVTVTVSEKVAGAIPEGTTLSVTPIVEGKEYTEVEAGLQEKAADEEYEIAGFLAYDICLVDAAGNEIEPNDNVNVSIEYDEAVIPEMETAKDKNLNVTVMHFEEDKNGEVAQIVDMVAEEKIEVTVKTTDAAKVEKAEFVTNSFSVFTITWVDGGMIKAYCVNTSGASIGEQEFVINNINITSETSIVDLSKDIQDYGFQRAYVATSSTGNAASKTVISRLRYNEGVWEYSTSAEGDDWVEVGERNLYFEYSANVTPARVPVADAAAAGIQINLYNYKVLSNGINSKNNGFYFHSGSNDGGIDRTAANQARITIDYGYGGSKGEFTSAWPQDVYQNYLRYNLGADGYPILNSDTNTSYGRGNTYTEIETDSSLNYLFTSNPEHVTAYTNVNGLFQKDSNGYYYYYSNQNHAQYNADTNTLDVYDRAAGNFLPFNNYSDASNSNYKSSRWDLWFGMNINTSFYQPEGGQIDGNDMIFEFSGDDDVWVFIDGVKVLDIGGIHDEKDGSINFATGTVSVEGKSNTTLATIYRTAFYEKYPNATNAEYTAYMDEIFNKDANGNYTTFKDYSGHTFKFFYFERGAGASNCKMKFNIPTMEAGTVQVKKELTNTDKEKYANVQFAFQLWAQEVESTNSEGVEIYKKDANGNDLYVPIDGATYAGTNTPVEFKDGVVFDGKTYDNVFYLKSGEAVDFADLQENRKYFVREIGVEADEYDVIVINGQEYKAYNGNGELTGSIVDVETNIDEVNRRPFVVCENNCSAFNSRELRITKTMKSGQSAGGDTFSFKIMLENQAGVLEEYVGEYYLKDASGNYYYYNNSGVLTSNGKNSRVCGTTSAKGIVEGVPVGYTVVVTQILSGTDFKVTEVNISDKYGNPVKTLTADTYVAATITGADGSIKLGDDAEMTIQNSLSSSSLRFTKKFIGPTGEEIQAPSNLAKIVLTIEEKYIASNSTNNYLQTHTLELVRNADGTFSGILENVQLYTDFAVLNETMYDVSNSVISNANDWTMLGYTVDRFSNPVVDATYITDGEESYVNLSAVGYVLVQKNSNWYLIMKYTDCISEEAVTAVINAVNAQGANLTREDVTLVNPEDVGTVLNATVTYQDGGVTKLQLAGTSVWNNYYQGKFETRSLVIEGQVSNKVDGKVQLTLTKEWDDDDNSYNLRPSSISASIMNGSEEVETLEITSENGWTATSSKLPKYAADGSMIEYTVVEEDVENYIPEINGTTITNHLKYNWRILKVSAQSSELKLQGAEFTLTPEAQDGTTYYGVSDATGEVKWYKDAEHTVAAGEILAGTYTMSETKAPKGYMVSNETWTFTFATTGSKPTVVSSDGAKDVVVSLSEETPLYTFEFANETLYSLPSNGGFGIYVYMFGGMMLMAFATFVLYKNRRKAVLVR